MAHLRVLILPLLLTLLLLLLLMLRFIFIRNLLLCFFFDSLSMHRTPGCRCSAAHGQRLLLSQRRWRLLLRGLSRHRWSRWLSGRNERQRVTAIEVREHLLAHRCGVEGSIVALFILCCWRLLLRLIVLLVRLLVLDVIIVC